MRSEITVILSNGDEHKLVVSDPELADWDPAKAAEWLAREFEAAGCVPPSPVGKLLLVDKVIVLARTQAEADFVRPTPWVRDFVRAVATTIDRRRITIDLAAGALSY